MVQNVETVHEFLGCVAEYPSAMMNLRDTLGEFGVIADLLEAQLEGIEIAKTIKSFEEPMKKMVGYVCMFSLTSLLCTYIIWDSGRIG